MIAVCAPDELLKELMQHKDQLEIISKEEIAENKQTVLLYLYDDAHSVLFNPLNLILINSVSTTLSALQMPPNILRINGWKTFIRRDTWEIAGNVPDYLEKILFTIGKKIILVNDEPGFVAARIVAMIINEAWFAKEDNVSTEKEIDLAMKLGTGYPYGPFEWGNIIGIQNILNLLNILSQTDGRYTPCELLKNASKS